MNLLDEILRKHSKAQCDKIVAYVGNDPVRFKELTDLFLKGPYRVTQRAAWPISYCVEYHPNLIKPHLKKILMYLKREGQHDAIKRNTLRLLQFVKIPRNLQGQATEICFKFLTSNKESIAVKVFAMTVLGNLCQVYPELKSELVPIIEDQLPYASAGFKARAKRILQQIKKH